PWKNEDYRRGYLCGVIRGDGTLGDYLEFRANGNRTARSTFRLAPSDTEALDRAQNWLNQQMIETTRCAFATATGYRPMQAIRARTRDKVAKVRGLIAWPDLPSRSWRAGFLAGIFDAEGSYSNGVLRISNTDYEIIRWIGDSLRELGFQRM